MIFKNIIIIFFIKSYPNQQLNFCCVYCVFKVVGAAFSDNDVLWSTNFKRSIASLFQGQRRTSDSVYTDREAIQLCLIFSFLFPNQWTSYLCVVNSYPCTVTVRSAIMSPMLRARLWCKKRLILSRATAATAVGVEIFIVFPVLRHTKLRWDLIN